jgi:hypothetical protein
MTDQSIDTYAAEFAKPTGVSIVDRLVKQSTAHPISKTRSKMSAARHYRVAAEIEIFGACLRKDIDTVGTRQGLTTCRLTGYSTTIPTGFRWVHDRSLTAEQVSTRNQSINRKSTAK